MRIIGLLPWILAVVMAQTPPAEAGRTPPTPAAIGHTVQQGDTLFSIARRYNTTVEALQRLNGLESNSLRLGQMLRLPLPVIQHTVQRGDTLFSIARRYGSSVEAIRAENRLESNSLGLGQVLRVPQAAAPAAQPAAPAQPQASSPPQQPAPPPAPAPQAANTPPPGGSNVNLVKPAALPSTPVPASAQAIPQPKLEGPPTPQPAAQAGNPAPPSTTAPPPPASTQAADTDYDPNSPFIPVILRYLGLPYVYGANSDRAVDCSAFVQQVFSELGVRVPRTSREQFAAFPSVSGAMRQGDLVFFSFGGSQIDHVGIYLGRGVFAHANSYGSRVVIESLDSPYYKKVFRGAKRIEVPLAGGG